MTSTTVSRLIEAPRAVLYRACLDPEALAQWRVPDNMTAKVHDFDARVGGTYGMSLTYVDPAKGPGGKTSESTDTFEGAFVELVPDRKIVERIRFELKDAKFAGEMKMTIRFEDAGSGTEVTILTENLPAGIRPEDNEEGCRQSLRKLARLVEPADAAYIPPASSCSYPLRTGNRVRPLIHGIPTFRRIVEAIDAARHSVWLTVTFFADDFHFPDGRGSLFDELDRAVSRGLDIRVLSWRHNPESSKYGQTFWGTPAEFDRLRARGSRVRIRWDRAGGAFCQHQKSWMIDAGHELETSFVGGINLTAAALGPRHDVYVEVTGPAATDVHRNFVQRWNGASERHEPNGNWACDSSDSLPLPATVCRPHGTSSVQIQRMLPAGRYADAAHGERSVLEQYESAIDAARRTIYLENQAIPVPAVAKRLLHALERGVEIVLLGPAVPEEHVFAARRDPAQRALFEGLERLAQHPTFRLAGLTRRDGQKRNPVYVHAKLMIVDDVWSTIGSCNLHFHSLNGHSEMNASIWDGAVTRDLRRALFREHLGTDTAELDDVQALRLFQRIADQNRRKFASADPDWQGQVFTLAAGAYGT